MSDRDTDLDRALRRVFDDDAASEAPSPEELAAYVAGRLDADAEDDLLARVADHPEAMDLLLELRRYGSRERSADAAQETSPAAVTAGVEEVMVRVGRGRPGVSIRFAPSWAMAAVLVLAVAAGWMLHRQVGLQDELDRVRDRGSRLEERLAEVEARAEEAPAEAPPEPRAGMPIVDLFAGSLRGEGGEAASVEPADGGPVTVILNPRDPVPGRAYRLTIVDPAAATRWRGPVTAEATGAVVVLLPRGFLSAGLWRLRLAAVDGEAEDELELWVRAGGDEAP